MSSQYEKIKTASDLVTEVQIHGLSMDQEDLCRVQDIFGHTPIDELARLANDNGRNNADGEPDPKGTWNSSRKPTQGTFYMIVSHIWNWEEVTRFWNTHTNPQTEQYRELKEEHKKLETLYNGLLTERDELKTTLKDLSSLVTDLRARIGEAQLRAEEAEAEVVRLKAKLYDILFEGKEAV